MIPILQRRDFLRSGAILAGGAVMDGRLALATGKAAAQTSTPTLTGWDLVPGILSQIVPPVFPARDFLVTAYQADPTGQMDSSKAFHTAIENCNRAGGGRVVVPAGTYLHNGPIYLRSFVNLYLAPGALVQFSVNPADYLPNVLVRWGGVRCYNYSPLIYSYQERNIAITGSGTFDGQAYLFWDEWNLLDTPDSTLLQQLAAEGVPPSERVFGSGHYLRPTMFEPYLCTNILVDGVTFQGSPFWTIHPTFCGNVTVSNVTVLEGTSNDDGCDPDSSHNVLITGCSFMTKDDSISIKAGMAPDSNGLPGAQNIVIQNCTTVSTPYSGFTIGSNISAGVKNVFVENYTAESCLNAIYFKGNVNAGGVVEDIYVRNSQAIDCHHLLTISPSAYGSTSQPLSVPTIADIYIDNVVCQDATVSGFAVAGMAQNPIENIVLTDVTIESSPELDSIANAQVVSSGLVYKGQAASISTKA